MNPSPADPIETVVPIDTKADAASPEVSSERTGGVPATVTPAAVTPAAVTSGVGRRVASVRMIATRFDLVVVGVAALIASVVGRAVAPALPGSSAGIGPLISGVEQ